MNKNCFSCKWALKYDGVAFKCGYAKEKLGVDSRVYPEDVNNCEGWESFTGSDAYQEGEEVMSDRELDELVRVGAKQPSNKVRLLKECPDCHGKGFVRATFFWEIGDHGEEIQCKKCGGVGLVD